MNHGPFIFRSLDLNMLSMEVWVFIFCIFWYFSLPHELFTTVLISKLEIFCCLFFFLLISSWISMIVRKHTLYDSNSFKFIEICLWLRIRICLSECSIDAWKEHVFCCCWVEHLSVKSCLLTVVFGSSKSLLILSYSPSVAENGGCWFSVLQSRQLLRMSPHLRSPAGAVDSPVQLSLHQSLLH